MSFFGELKRRNVVRVGLAYAVVVWLLLQFVDLVLDNITAPPWVMHVFMLALAVGFPIALVFAWAFEMTPDGIKRESEVDRSASVTPQTGRKLDLIIIAALVVALGYFVVERQGLIHPSDSAPAVQNNTGPSGATEEETAVAATIVDKSIAVIPFINMSSDQEQEWFADGLTEEILNSLARTPDLLVTARTSSFAYKGSDLDAPSIAEALGVAHILEGSVRRSGDRLRVTAQLIRANDGFHLWSETYDRKVEDLIDIQENVAIEIANAMETAMDPDALASMVTSGTSSVPAFEAYMRGLSFGLSTFALGDPYRYLTVKDSYETALAHDPEFARAWWQLSDFWSIQLDTTLQISGITELSTEEILANYLHAVNNAIKYEKNDTNTLLYKASKARAETKHAQATRLLDEYLKSRPNDHSAQILQLVVYSETGNIDGIESSLTEYLGRDDHNTGVIITSMSALLAGDDPQVIRDYANTFLSRYPDHIGVAYQAHRMLLWAGDIDGASGLIPRLQSSEMDETSIHLAMLRQACAENRLGDAREMYARANEKYMDDLSIIWLSRMIMGETEQATALLTPFDEAMNLRTLTSFLNYSWFDVSAFPNLSAKMAANGTVRPEPKRLPYQCKTST